MQRRRDGVWRISLRVLVSVCITGLILGSFPTVPASHEAAAQASLFWVTQSRKRLPIGPTAGSESQSTSHPPLPGSSLDTEWGAYLPLVLRAGVTPSVTSSPTATPTPIPTATGTPTSTPTSTPTPTVTPGVITLERVWTTDLNDQARTAFITLDDIRLWLHIRNRFPTPVDADVRWEVRSPDGIVVDALSWSGTLSIDPAQPNRPLERRIPPINLPRGQYTFTGSVIYGGQTSTRSAVLYLARNLMLADDFSDPSSGWPSVDQTNYAASYLNGEYRIFLKASNRTVWATPWLSLSDLVLEVDGRNASQVNGAYGLLFALSDDVPSFYAFLARSDGYYRIRKHTAGGWQTLQDWTAASALNQGPASNHLMVVRRSAQIAVYANGTHLATVTDSALPPGWVGLVAASFDEATMDARFDNFRAYWVWETESSVEAASAAGTFQHNSSEVAEPPPGE